MIRVDVTFSDHTMESTECEDYAQMLTVIESLEDQGPWEIYIEVPHAVG